MSGFGDKLRREREMRGVSIEEISDSTKISGRSLRALEQEDFEKLPGGIFNKGFVRAYARFLGLDEERTVADFESAWKEYKAATGLPDDERQLPIVEEESETSKSGFAWVLVILVIGAVLAGVGYAVRHHTSRASYHPDVAPAVQAPPPLRAASEPTSPSSASVNAQSARAKSNETTTGAETQNPTAAPLPNSNSSPDTKTVGTITEAKESAAKHLASNAPIRLQVFAREDSWLSVLADGKDLGQGILSAQKTRTIHAEKQVKLTVGNVGGVEVSFNGKPVDIDGEPKQVKQLTFTPDGLQQ